MGSDHAKCVDCKDIPIWRGGKRGLSRIFRGLFLHLKRSESLDEVDAAQLPHLLKNPGTAFLHIG